MHALIDGDWILYAAGFAGQKTKYVVPSLRGALEFDNVTELREATADDLTEDDHIYSRIALDPPSHFFHSAKNMIETQLQKIADRFKLDNVPYTVMMDGDGNFRSRLATIRPYKGNRSPNSKPAMYNDIRQYLLDAHHAEVIHGQETDDEMAIVQSERFAKDRVYGMSSIIVAVDKDMLQVPGWHLNPNKGFMRVTHRRGRTRLYRQCLTGDSVDNIMGAYKVGPAAAAKLIAPSMTEEQMWSAVLEAYAESMGAFPDVYPEGMTPEDAAIENMRLVYLRRERGEIWMPPC